MDDLTTRERSDLRSLVQASAEHERRRSARRGRWVAGGVSVLAVAAIATGATLAALAPRVDSASDVAAEVVGTWVSDAFPGILLEFAADGSFTGADSCAPVAGTWEAGSDATIELDLSADADSTCEGGRTTNPDIHELTFDSTTILSIDDDILHAGTSSSDRLRRVADDHAVAGSLVGTFSAEFGEPTIVLRADGSYRYDAGCEGISYGEWYPLTNGDAVLGPGSSTFEAGIMCLRLSVPIIKIASEAGAVRGFRAAWLNLSGSPDDAGTPLTRFTADPDAPVGTWASGDRQMTLDRNGLVHAELGACAPYADAWEGRWKINPADGSITIELITSDSAECEPHPSMLWWNSEPSSSKDELLLIDADGDVRTFERMTP